jgi:quinolinate synthase
MTTAFAHALFDKLKSIQPGNPLCSYTFERCMRLSPLIEEISSLKEKKKAQILAHTYVHPDIIYGVADHVGDSYALALKARESTHEQILFPAVRFMAETAKILNPSKVVIDPNPYGGCSLAESISAEEVLSLRERHPHHTFVCYINTTAAVKAVCDVCVTSSNVYRIIEKIDNDKIYFLPDRLMGQNLVHHLKRNKIDKELLFSSGTCYVHESFTPEQIDLVKMQHKDAIVLAHPECDPAVVAKADVVSSTTGMLDYVKQREHAAHPFLLLTECGVASRLQAEAPHAKLIGACTLCKYMRSNSLESILQALKDPLPSQIITLDPAVQQGALRCLNAMFEYTSH